MSDMDEDSFAASDSDIKAAKGPMPELPTERTAIVSAAPNAALVRNGKTVRGARALSRTLSVFPSDAEERRASKSTLDICVIPTPVRF